jgi:hypothetical protein
MSTYHEIYQDIINVCDILLNKLSGYNANDDTPEGRMINQCRWLKQEAQAQTLTFPIKRVRTLRYINSEKSLAKLATSPDYYNQDVGIHLYRLIKLSEGLLLLKPPYYIYAAHCIEALIRLLENPGRSLSNYERDTIPELKTLKDKLLQNHIEPPLMTWEDYPNFRKVYRISRSTIDDLPDGKRLCKTVANLIFEGVRPSSWTSPKAAARDTGDF